MLSPDFKLFQSKEDSTASKLKKNAGPPTHDTMPITLDSRFERNVSGHEQETSDLLINKSVITGKENDLNQSKSKPSKISRSKEPPTKAVKKRKHVSQQPSTPSRQPSKVVGIMSSLKKKGGKIVRNLTPPRHLHIGIQTPSRQRQSNLLRLKKNNLGESVENNQNQYDSPRALTLSSRFDKASEYTIRSSEIDPSPFQLDIPSHESVLAHCKICCILENYFEIGGLDFDFCSLMPWVGGTNNAKQDGPYERSNQRPTNREEDDKSKKVLANLQGIVDDIIVEGFFRDFYVDENAENGLARIESCVFSSSKLRRFIVCYRCSSDLQDRPLQGIQHKKTLSKAEPGSSASLHQSATGPGATGPADDLLNNCEHSRRKKQENLVLTDVNESFLKVFQNEKLQGNLSTLLCRLASLKPFYDIAMTGHSFSGGIATLSSYSYALNHPATRVYCHVFGSPIVGGSYFRDQVHSLPNLNLIRVERSTDPFVNLPEVSANNKCKTNDTVAYNNKADDWIHAGHCLRLTPTCSIAISDEAKRPVDLKLYRFDKLRPTSNFMKASLISVSNLKKLKIGNEINSYKKDLEKIDRLKIDWVHHFEGMAEKVLSSNGVFA